MTLFLWHVLGALAASSNRPAKPLDLATYIAFDILPLIFPSYEVHCIVTLEMSSSVFYRFKSSKQPARVAFDGTGISVFELKKEIIISSGLGNGLDFDLVISSNEGDRGLCASVTEKQPPVEPADSEHQSTKMIPKSYHDRSPLSRDACRQLDPGEAKQQDISPGNPRITRRAWAQTRKEVRRVKAMLHQPLASPSRNLKQKRNAWRRCCRLGLNNGNDSRLIWPGELLCAGLRCS